MTEPATFDEMAVALALAAGKAKMDVDQLDLVGPLDGLVECDGDQGVELLAKLLKIGGVYPVE